MKSTTFFISTIFVVFFINSVCSQTPDITWSKNYGGQSFENGFDVKQTDDGGYIVIGYQKAEDHLPNDVYVIKTDSEGNEIWSNTYGGDKTDKAYSVAILPDGGYVIVGHTESFGEGLADGFLLRIDSVGNEVWFKTYGTNSYEYFKNIILTPDGNLMVMGTTFATNSGLDDISLTKFDVEGNIIWAKTYGGDGVETGNDIHQTSDDGFLIAGESDIYNSGKTDMYILKTDNEGNESWYNTFGTTEWDHGGAAIETSDGGIFLAGHTWSFDAGQGYDISVVKMDKDGNELWESVYTGTSDDRVVSVIEDTDGGIVIGGYGLIDVLVKNDYIMIKLNSYGDEIWRKDIGGSENEFLKNMIKTKEGGYMFVGRTESFGNNGSSDIWIVKTTSGLVSTNDQLITTSSLGQNSPNPFSNDTKISYSLSNSAKVKISVYDIFGKNIKTLADRKFVAGTHVINFNSDGLPNGLYLYDLKINDRLIDKKKMVVFSE